MTVRLLSPRFARALALLGASLLLPACGSDVEDGAGGGGGSSSTTSSGAVDFGACSERGTCTLASKSCCGVCGMPTLADLDPVRVDALAAHTASVCPSDEDLACPDCESEPNPLLFASCDLDAGRCIGHDLATSELAACSGPDDCVLRAGLGCCTCGSNGPWVAIAATRNGELASLVCGEEESCPACEPEPPEGLFADCVEGVCTAVVLEG